MKSQIYFYVEGKYIKEIFSVCKSLGINILTTDKDTHQHFLNRGVLSKYLNKSPKLFKKMIIDINPKLIILNNDNISSRQHWIAKNFKTLLIFEFQIDTRHRFKIRKSFGFIGSKTAKFLHKLLGITGLLYGNQIDIHDTSLKTYIRLIRDRLFFDYRPISALPGWHCDKVIVQNEEIRKLCLENNFLKKKLINIGSPYEDYYLKICKMKKNIKQDIDILLFSQPFYLRGFDEWLKEVEELVEDCHKNKFKLTIKLHPRDDPDRYSSFKSKCQIIYSDGSPDTIVNLIQRSYAIVLKHSTVMILSLLCNRPIIFINYKGVSPFLDNKIDFLPSMVLSKKNDIKSIRDNIYKNYELIMEHQKNKLKKIGKFDNNSLSRFSDLIEKMV